MDTIEAGRGIKNMFTRAQREGWDIELSSSSLGTRMTLKM